MTDKNRKVLATLLSVSLLFTPTAKDKGEVRDLPPEPIRIEEQKSRELKMKKKA